VEKELEILKKMESSTTEIDAMINLHYYLFSNQNLTDWQGIPGFKEL